MLVQSITMACFVSQTIYRCEYCTSVQLFWYFSDKDVFTNLSFSFKQFKEVIIWVSSLLLRVEYLSECPIIIPYMDLAFKKYSHTKASIVVTSYFFHNLVFINVFYAQNFVSS